MLTLEKQTKLYELKHMQCLYAASRGGILSLREADDTWNNFNREIIKEYAKVYPNCRLGSYNKAETVSYTGQKIYNFDYDFIISEPDEELKNLIEKRLFKGYTDMASIMKIQNRIEAKNGEILIWK